MSILIKMEMPKNCNSCPFCGEEFVQCSITKSRFFKVRNAFEKRHPNCPLIEVPKHGRWELYNNTGMGFSHRCSLCGFAVRERWISLYKFCPQCGAEMREAEGEDD